jgi:hypothetical protein
MLVKKGSFATLTSWSFSTYMQYTKCAFSVCLDKVQRVRIKEPDNPAFAKGDRAHAIAESFVSGTGKPPALKEKLLITGGPPIELDLTPVKELLISLRNAHASVELEWAFDRQYNPVGWSDWAKAWVRMKADVCRDDTAPPEVDIVDWKTGKVHVEDHRLQRRLYALGGLRLVQIGALAGGSKDVTLTAKHVYIDTGQTATEEFKMKDLSPLKKEWEARVKQMMADTVYRATPGWHCKYCRFNHKTGGPCREGV